MLTRRRVKEVKVKEKTEIGGKRHGGIRGKNVKNERKKKECKMKTTRNDKNTKKGKMRRKGRGRTREI